MAMARTISLLFDMLDFPAASRALSPKAMELVATFARRTNAIPKTQITKYLGFLNIYLSLKYVSVA